MNNSRTTKIILIVVSILFILAVVSDIFWFRFVQNTASKISALRMQVNAETSQSYNLTQMKKKTVEIQSRQVFVDQIFLNKEDTVSFIESIENIGRLSGVVVEIQLVDAVQDGSYGKLNMVFDASGSWPTISRFLNLIENLPYHATINSVKMNSVDGSTDSGPIWEMNTSITVITK